MNRQIAFVHGGIGINYVTTANRYLKNSIFQKKLKLLEDNFNLRLDLQNKPSILTDSLENQLLSYTSNCFLTDLYANNNVLATYHIGHSMGLYSCLYAGRFYNFLTGAKIICKVYQLLKDHFQDKGYILGIVIGLSENELHEILGVSQCEICIVNGYNNFVISGKNAEVKYILHTALDNGATYANFINTNLPYHTSESIAIRSRIESYLLSMDIYEPLFNCHVYSLVDHKKICFDNCIMSIIDMICSRINFCYGVYFLSKMFTKNFCEIGPRNKLAKLIHKINPEIIFV